MNSQAGYFWPELDSWIRAMMFTWKCCKSWLCSQIVCAGVFAKAILPVWKLNLDLGFFFFTLLNLHSRPRGSLKRCLKKGSLKSVQEMTSELPLCSFPCSWVCFQLHVAIFISLENNEIYNCRGIRWYKLHWMKEQRFALKRSKKEPSPPTADNIKNFSVSKSQLNNPNV